eukprot:s1833_g18.t1
MAMQVPKCETQANGRPSLPASDNVGWVGGALGSAVTRKKRENKSKDEPEELSLLEAAEAVVRTTRMGFLPENQLAENLQRLLTKFTGTWESKPKAHQQQEQNDKPIQQPKPSEKIWYEREEWPQPSSQKHIAKHQANRQVVWNATAPASKRIQAFITSEWQHEPIITTAAKVLDAIMNDSADMPGTIVEVTEEQAESLTDAWQAFEPDKPMTMCWQGTKAEEQEVTRKVRVQFLDCRDFRPTQLVFRTLGNASSPLPKPAKAATVPSMTNEAKVQIRVTAPVSYRRTFVNTKADGPQAILAEIREWKLSEATMGQLTGGDWKRNYTKQGTQIQGHLRVREALATQLLQKSGTKAIFFTKTGNRDGQAKVQWHERKSQENDEEYFRRITSQAASEPLRFRTGGAAGLGTDCTEASSKSKLHWELQGAPANWDDKDLSAFLESNKWIVHKIHSRRKGYRKSWTGTFQATAPDAGAESHMYAPDADHSFFIHPTAPPRRFQVYAEPLTRPRQKWGSAMPERAQEAEASDSRPAKKQKAALDEQHQKQPEPAKPEVSPTQLDPATQPEKKRGAPEAMQPSDHPPDPLNPLDVEQAIKAGWCEKDMGGGGDCFFRAFVKAENHFFNREQKEAEVAKAAMQLRIDAVQHIRKHKTLYEAAWCHGTME